MAFNNDITINFTNDGGDADADRNVYFKSDQTTEVEGPIGNSWNCGSEEANYRCNQVRDGNFKWGGEYKITLGKFSHSVLITPHIFALYHNNTPSKCAIYMHVFHHFQNETP